MKIKIDGKWAECATHQTVLQVAETLGISIPTLCHHRDLPHQTSCFLCVVKDRRSGKLLPACSTTVAEGMDLLSGDETVVEARRQCLDLLHSEHLGDCEAPCERGCPAHMDIPAMLRALAEGRDEEACRIVLERIALPSVVGRICPAPCEKICRRGPWDGAVAICNLKRFASDKAHENNLHQELRNDPTGKTVAVVGAGPAGLAAAFYLAKKGHRVTVFDEHEEIGGTLRYEVPEHKLPKEVLDRDIARVTRQGVIFKMGQPLGAAEITQLLNEKDAVILTTGRVDQKLVATLGLKIQGYGLAVGQAFETSVPKLFARAIQQTRSPMAIRSLADGWTISGVVHGFMTSGVATRPRAPFQSITPRINHEELEGYLGKSNPSPRTQRNPGTGTLEGLTPEEVRQEARRCLSCDCSAKNRCTFRVMSTQWGAKRDRYPKTVKPIYQKRQFAFGITYEMGKCIRCGLCVRESIRQGISEPYQFAHRGRHMEVVGPLSLDEKWRQATTKCVGLCPTGALAKPQP